MERGKYRALTRGITAWKLHYWRGERDRAGNRFVSRPGPHPSILFNEDFLQYQRAWGKIGALEARLERLGKE